VAQFSVGDNTDVSVIDKALSVTRVDVRSVAADAEAIFEGAKAIVGLLPAGWGIRLLPEVEGVPRNTLPRLKRLCPTIEIAKATRKPDSKFRFTIFCHDGSKSSPRTLGLNTTMFRVLLASRKEALLSLDRRRYGDD
jgi:hypothetical protein